MEATTDSGPEAAETDTLGTGDGGGDAPPADAAYNHHGRACNMQPGPRGAAGGGLAAYPLRHRRSGGMAKLLRG